MKSAEIREAFLGYFEKNGHTRVKSSSLIPAADPTLLFTNAGMVQFKDCFLGLANNGYSRATTAQKCVRAGGKHNDLENVGFTARHHTFFEMLGNFSFGDYFKEQAIAYAWDLLTNVLKLPVDRLRITVFQDDDEAFELWKKQGVRPEWIERLGEKDNFWAMGDTGPCGPCTEIYFDWGAKYGKGNSPGTDAEGRFVEIWNNVFMQYNRDTSGKLTPLPKPSVDTGAGLERMACALQGVYSNYDTDLFQPLLKAIGARVGKAYGQDEAESVSMRVIADHLRSTTFLMADGVTPSNEGRGYVLRRILRRAIRHGKKLGQDRPFIHDLVGSVVTSLGAQYPEIKHHQKMVEVLVKEEEAKFHETLHRGMGILEDAIGKTRSSKSTTLPGDVTFRLYDTFGFPLDLIQVIAAENGLAIDEKDFEVRMEKQRSQSAWTKGGDDHAEAVLKVVQERSLTTKFVGYQTLESRAKLVALLSQGKVVNELKAGEEGFAVFEQTPFYAESGGQVGDRGAISGGGALGKVLDTRKAGTAFIHHVGVDEGRLHVGEAYDLSVDEKTRQQTAINHTATHLMHAALRKVLGDRVKQAGSLVEPNRLRFDFTFPRAVNEDELFQIETLVNAQIRARNEVSVQEMGYDDAIKSGALAFFDEKYGDRVRVVRVGGTHDPFSVELCGGTHLHNISEVGFFKITSESSVASGVRRIEAVTSELAIDFLVERNRLLEELEDRLGTRNEAVLKKVDAMLTDIKTLQRENEKLQVKAAQAGAKSGGEGGGALWDKKVDVNGLQVITEAVAGVNPKVLRTLVDQARDKLKQNAVVVLTSETEGKVSVCVGLSKDLVGKYDAGKLIQGLAKDLGGTGGGRGDFAQGGGTQPGKVDDAFANFREWLKSNS